MRLNSTDKINERPNNNLQYYVLAVVGGVFVGITLKFIIKAITSLVLLAIQYWMWAIGIVLGILVMFKLMRKKK